MRKLLLGSMQASLLFLSASVCWSQGSTASLAGQSQVTDAKDRLCTVAGIVLRAATGEPLKRARATLVSQVEQHPHSLVAITDASGHFSVEKVPPGCYTMEVERVGYVSQSYGQDGPDKPGATLTLEPGKKMTDLLFRLQSASVIAGHVHDEDGEPAQDVNVEVLRRTYSSGKIEVGAVGGATTNDRGEYRVFGLAPGRFYVRATMQSGLALFFSSFDGESVSESSPQHVATSYAPTYYPGTTDLNRAIALELRVGEEIPEIDLSLSLNRTYRVRGHVATAIGAEPPGNIGVTLLPRDESTPSGSDFRQGSADAKTGEFEITGVPPGSYALVAFCQDEGKLRTAFEDIDVQDANVDGVSIIFRPGIDIPGHVDFEGKAEADAQLTVGLVGRDRMFFGSREAPVKSDGSFLLSGVGDGDYSVHVGSSCTTCYLKSAAAGGADILQQGLRISSGAAPPSIEIVYSNETGTVNGVVTRQDGLPAAGALVVLVPDPPFRKDSERYERETTDQYGAFTIRGVPPGNYKAFAWEKIEEGAYEDPEFLKPVEKMGESVEVQENGKKTLQLKLIPATSGQPQS
jgi:hypothetical protein